MRSGHGMFLVFSAFWFGLISSVDFLTAFGVNWQCYELRWTLGLLFVLGIVLQSQPLCLFVDGCQLHWCRFGLPYGLTPILMTLRDLLDLGSFYRLVIFLRVLCMGMLADGGQLHWCHHFLGGRVPHDDCCRGTWLPTAPLFPRGRLNSTHWPCVHCVCPKSTWPPGQ